MEKGQAEGTRASAHPDLPALPHVDSQCRVTRAWAQVQGAWRDRQRGEQGPTSARALFV